MLVCVVVVVAVAVEAVALVTLLWLLLLLLLLLFTDPYELAMLSRPMLNHSWLWFGPNTSPPHTSSPTATFRRWRRAAPRMP